MCMCPETIALTTAESVDLAIAGATLLLAVAAAVMALFVRSQAGETARLAGETARLAGETARLARQSAGLAGETARLADVAEAQLQSEYTPILKIMREDDPSRAAMVTVNEGTSDQSLVVWVENRGLAAAEPVAFRMSPGGPGRLAALGEPRSPVIEPGGKWVLDFRPSKDDKVAHASGSMVLVELAYLAIRSGRRYQMNTSVQRVDDEGGERWFIIGEQPSQRLAGVP